MATASERCDKVCKELQAKYPTVGLTFGYIGNVYGMYGHPSWHDERLWMFFTQVPIKRATSPAQRETFGWHETSELDNLAAAAEGGELEAFILKRCLYR